MNLKHSLLALSLCTLLSSGTLLAQVPAGPPPGGPPIQLTDDQKARMKAVHEAFRKKMEADRQVFETNFKSILTKSQLAIVQEGEAKRAAFKQGQEKARALLKQHGQPVPPDHPEFGMFLGPMGPRPMGPHEGGPDGGPHFGPPGGPGMMWMHRGGGEHHDGDRPDMDRLKLTPEQKGEMSVFRASMMEQVRKDMEGMRQQMDGILTPEQKAQMQQWHGQHHRGDHPHPPPQQ